MRKTVESLSTWLRRIERWTVLTGAGISADSGIPTYRDQAGKWLRVDPIQHKEFIESDQKRKRYWARSMVGWPSVEKALPNAHHTALATLERIGKISTLITQNVDRLHQKAGSQRVIDLHGRLDRVVCLSCGQPEARAALQARLLATNPFVVNYSQIARPDGDADVPDHFVAQTQEPVCTSCGGTLMPDVVFFGDSVPRTTVDEIFAAIDAAGALLVIGSSLMVYSGFRFCRHAHQAGFPLACINPGATRADDLFTLKSESGCTEQLQALAAGLAGG